MLLTCSKNIRVIKYTCHLDVEIEIVNFIII